MASASTRTARDLRLRPRLLLALLNNCLPLPDDEDKRLAPPLRLGDLAYAADAVRVHGLLAEHTADDGDPGLREEWSAVVDAWVGRLLGLMDSDRGRTAPLNGGRVSLPHEVNEDGDGNAQILGISAFGGRRQWRASHQPTVSLSESQTPDPMPARGKEHSCWVGTSFLGLTCQECSDGHFVKSYSDWFQKVLGNMKLIAHCKMDCTTQHQSAILSKFAYRFATFFHSVLAHQKAPSCIQMVNMSTCVTMYDLFVRLSTFSKLRNDATSLARKVIKPLLRLLDNDGPVTEKAADLLGLLMQLFPSSVYRHFNNVESVITAKIMSGQYNLQQLKKLASTLALLPCVRISQNSISLMIQKILIVVNNMLNDTFIGLKEEHSDEELLMLLVPPGTKLVPPQRSQTSYGDRHILSTTRSHAYVLLAISGLIHCCSVMLTSSYPIQVTNIPVRALVTLIQKVLLIDGSLHKSLFQSNTSLYQELVCLDIPPLHSTFLDLLSSTVKGMRSSLIPHAGLVVTLIVEYFKRAKLPSIRRKLYTVVRLLLSSIGVGMVMQLLQVVISNIFADLDDNSRSSLFSACTDPVEPAIWSNTEQRQQLQNSTVMSSESTCTRQVMAPLCVKIGALETLEVLFNVGGSFRLYSWGTEVDLLLIDVARDAYYTTGMYEQKPSCNEDPSISDFQLASFKALLASFLANPHERPPYLEQGLELFNRGKLEAGTELGIFCSHALLALDVLLHPRQLPSHGGAHSGLGLRHGGAEHSVHLGSGISQAPCSSRKRRATNDLGDASVQLSRLQKDAPWSHINGEHSEMDTCLPTDGAQAVPVPGSSRTDAKMANGSCRNRAASDTMGDPLDSFSVHPAPISTTTPDSRNHGDEISNKKSGRQGCVLSSDDASSNQNVPVPVQTSPIFDVPSVPGSEWDPLDALLGIDDIDVDS